MKMGMYTQARGWIYLSDKWKKEMKSGMIEIFENQKVYSFDGRLILQYQLDENHRYFIDLLA